MNTDNPWFDHRTPKDFILSRNAVTELTQDIIGKIVSDGENAMRRKDINGVMSLIALDFEYLGPELIKGEIKIVPGNRDRFLIGLCGTFEASDCDNYSTEISSVEITTPEFAKVSLIIRNPGEKQFTDYYGPEVIETLIVGLYKGAQLFRGLKLSIRHNNALVRVQTLLRFTCVVRLNR